MKRNVNLNYVLAAGFARLPKETVLYEMHKMIGCVLIIDREKDRIEDATFTCITEVGNKFISSLIRGNSIENGIEEIVQVIENRFFVPSQRAIIQVFRSAYDRYCEMTKDQKNSGQYNNRSQLRAVTEC